MLADIGLMGGAYIITRMLAMMLNKPGERSSFIVIIFCVLTIIVAVFAIGDILTKGTQPGLTP